MISKAETYDKGAKAPTVAESARIEQIARGNPSTSEEDRLPGLQARLGFGLEVSALLDGVDRYTAHLVLHDPNQGSLFCVMGSADVRYARSSFTSVAHLE